MITLMIVLVGALLYLAFSAGWAERMVAEPIKRKKRKALRVI